MHQSFLRRIALSALVVLAVGALPAQQVKTYAAANVKELLKNIGSDRVIVLKKGDYVLDTGSDFSSANVEWLEADDGRKELEITGVKNLTIRGVDGTRFVSQSAMAYLLGVYESSKVTFDNIDFVRTAEAGDEGTSGLLYAEGVEGFTVDRSSFSGPAGYPLELWECGEVAFKRSTMADAFDGAVYGGYVSGFSATDADFSGLGGWPLFYFEESDYVSFENSSFSDNEGGNFMELWAEGGYMEEAAFRNCEFTNNQFDYFAGSEILPSTEDCSFSDNSFDEDWPEYSVAPISGDEYYGYEGDAGPAWYWNEASMLSCYYPNYWSIDEDTNRGRAVMSSPDEEVMVWFSKAFDIPAKVDPEKTAKKLFADSAAALSKAFKAELGVTMTLKESVAPIRDELDLLVGEYVGTAVRSGGAKSSVRVKLAVARNSVWALVALSPDSSLLEEYSEADGILASLEFSPME